MSHQPFAPRVRKLLHRYSLRQQITALLFLIGFFALFGLLNWRIRLAQAAGTITGVVYLDYNQNGARDTGGAAPNYAIDIGLGGVTVTAYDSGGTARGTATSCVGNGNPTAFCTGSNNGAYSLSATGTGPYRIEFTNLPSGSAPGASVGSNGSTVRFVADGSTANLDLAVSQPDDYCQNNPTLCTPVLRPGNQSGARSTAVSFPYNGAITPRTLANEAQTGGVWGVAYQPQKRTVFVSAMMKRHVGFGPLGTGGIYKIDLSAGTPAASNFIDVKTIGIDTGTDPRNVSGYAALPADGSTPNWDYAAYTEVGKRSIGDMDYDAARNTLWLVNLADRRLHGINNLDPAVTPTSANVLKDSGGAAGFAVNTSPAITCANGVLRPWGLKVYRGLVYVGAVCTAENAGSTAADLRAYVLSFNPDSPAAGFTQVISYPLNYTRTKVTFGGDSPWRPWRESDTDRTRPTAVGGLEQPILAGIEFDKDGSLVMGLLDRWGDQVAIQQYGPDTAQTNTALAPEQTATGDILRFCKNGAAFADPGTAQCPNNARPAGENGNNNGGSQGPGGGEFYSGDWGPDDPDSFGDTAHGALAYLPGAAESISTVHDATIYHSGGVLWMSNSTGQRIRGYDVFNHPQTNPRNSINNFHKANGMGDLELLCDSAPLQVGNRVWTDADGDGVQDSNENGVANVAVQLWGDTNNDGAVDTQVGAGTTDGAGHYYFGGPTQSNMLSSCANSVLPTQTVASSANDAVENTADTTVNLTATSLSLGSNATNATIAGVRFAALNIPRGARIVSASVTFTANGNDTATPVGLNIQGEGNSNSAAFTSTNANISSRARTSATVNWQVAAWTAGATTNATTPDLSALVQEVVNYGDWQSGQPFTLLIRDDGTTGTRRRRARSADNANAAQLNVTYSTCAYVVQPDTKYEVRVPSSNFGTGQPLNGQQLTRLNADATANGDARDSDGTFASVSGGSAILAAFTTGKAGNNNHTIDFGFKTNAVSLGNRVFHDADNSGALTAGEGGLAGVAVELYNSTGTTLLGATATDAGGYYSFPGLTSGTAYHVRLAASNFNAGGVLAGYSSSTGAGSEGVTTPDANLAGSADGSDKGTTTGTLGSDGYAQTRVAVTVTAGSAPTGEENGAGDTNADNSNNLKVDFGLYAYSLGNRVWRDNGAGAGGVANDGVLNGTEAGIAGVSVSLLADADNNGIPDGAALAAVTTDAGGYYRFDALKPGFYIVRVDSANFSGAGVLTGLANSAGGVNAGSNSTDSRDNGVNNFSPAVNGILSNTINVGTKTVPTGETDNQTPGAYGAGATTGRENANSLTDLTVDFGFTNGYSLGNRVWSDSGAGGGTANDGIRNGTEPGVGNVSVSLFTDTGCDGALDGGALATVTTDSTGYYRFDHLAPACYIVRVNPSNFLTGGPLSGSLSSTGNVNAGSNANDNRDAGIDPASAGTTGVLTNAINVGTKTVPTTETDNQTPGTYGSGAFTGLEMANNFTDLTVDFGFRTGAPTAVTLKSFTAETDGQRAVLRWQTGFETNNLGFRVYRETGRQRREVTPSLIAGSGLLARDSFNYQDGFAYAWVDENYQPGAVYYLEDIDLKGASATHGPLSPAVAKGSLGAPRQARLMRDANASARPQQTDGPKLPKALRVSSNPSGNAGAKGDAALGGRGRFSPANAPAVKIAVNREGWQRVNRAALLAAGLPAQSDAGDLRLWRDGQEVSVLVTNDGGVEFYGSALDTAETDSAVYWLTWGQGPGLRVGSMPAAAENGLDEAWYWRSAERRDRNFYFSSLLNGPASNFFGAVVGGANATSQMLNLDAPAANAADAEIDLTLQGATGGLHTVRVEFNGVMAGVLEFRDQEAKRLRVNVPASQVRGGANEIKLTALGGAADYSLVSALRLTYGRAFQAAGDTLSALQPAGLAVRLKGFTNSNIRVFDVSDAQGVKELQVVPQEVGAGQYAVNVAGGATDRRLYALARAGDAPARVWANAPTNLRGSRKGGAEAVAITPAAFRPAAEQWAELRKAQGMSVEVVDIEDIYDEFAHGVADSGAVKAFAQWSSNRWQTRYLLLFGAATYDPRDFLGSHQVSWLPAPAVDTEQLETASDDWFGDFDDDGAPEVPTGRLPARTLAEAQAIVGKIAAYEQQAPATRRGAVLFNDQGFANYSQQLGNQLSGRMPVVTLNRGSQPDAQLRGELLTRLNAGPAVVQYNGHGSISVWAGSFFGATEAADLTNHQNLSVYVLLTCLNGYHHDIYSDSLGASLVRAPGGAVAAWASSGLTYSHFQEQMARGFYDRWLENGVRLGDAIRAGKASTGDHDTRRTWTLLGDPTLVLR
jgi:hypothetical protein